MKSNEPIEIYEKIKLALLNSKIDISDYKLIDFGLQFSVYINNWSGLIRIYQNKKGISRIDYSQIKNGEKSVYIQNLIEKIDSHTLGGTDDYKSEIKFPYIGTDESGKGDFFGPLVIAGIYLDKQLAAKLFSIGIRDSKKLRDGKNLELSIKIKEICRNYFSIIEISPEKYNLLYEQFRKEGKKLNSLLAWGHAKSIEEILLKKDCEIAVSDQFADEKFILDKLQEKGKKIKLIQMHKAERHISVAAASILARARYLDKLNNLSQIYSIELPKGASKKVIETGKQFVQVHGKDALGKVAKLHFRTLTEIMES